jgi:hypothetical protein
MVTDGFCRSFWLLVQELHRQQDFPGFPHPPSKKESISNGSANAFEWTEKMSDDDGDGHDREK